MTEAHRFDIRVYYEDTDFSGVVYHANYLRFLERGRTEMLRALGIRQADLFAATGGPPLVFVVAHMDIDFRRPARMDDLLCVETDRLAVGGASLRMAQRLLRGPDLIVEASVKIAMVADGRVARIPAALATMLAGPLPARPSC